MMSTVSAGAVIHYLHYYFSSHSLRAVVGVFRCFCGSKVLIIISFESSVKYD